MSQLSRYVLLPAVIGAFVGLLLIATMRDAGEQGDRRGYSAAVAAATPAVVNIYSTKISNRSPVCQHPLYRQLCEAFPGEPQVENALGSGVIVRSDGYILTNEHVVAGADEILVMFANSQTTTAQVIGTDPHTDLAVIRVGATNLPTIPYDLAVAPRVGDIALAIGNPFGFDHSVSQGIVSATSRALITDSPYDDFLQTDAAISPGNSGGALVDSEGRLLGINTMIFSSSGGSEGLGFAIPTKLALDVLDQILRHGRVIRGWLGISLTPTPLPSADPNQPLGRRVTGLSTGGPAHRAGIRVGDMVLSINRIPATNAEAITQTIADTPPGESIAIEVVRGDQRFLARATAGEVPRR